jgi:glucosyl-3-phosphoglycerate synthase
VSERDVVAVLVAARDEESVIGQAVRVARVSFPEAEIVVADDGSSDATGARAAAAGARVVSLPRRGKGQALTMAEATIAAGRLVLCDADLEGCLRPLAAYDEDLVVAAFVRPVGGGIGLARGTSRALIRLLAGEHVRAPLSGQRLLSSRARRAAFPVAAGFGVETRMTIDVSRAGGTVREIELDLSHRGTSRDVRGFAHRGRQLADVVLACLPQGVSNRGLRLPLVGAAVALVDPGVAPVAALGLADDLWGGAERGFAEHLGAGATTGTLKLVGIPLWALLRTRSLSGALLVGLTANAVNQLDTRPGRALKAFVLGSLAVGGVRRRMLGVAILLAPYDLREMTMLGDAGANALGAVLGFSSVRRFTGRRRWYAIGVLAALTALGERRSLGELIESMPGLGRVDALGRRA